MFVIHKCHRTRDPVHYHVKKQEISEATNNRNDAIKGSTEMKSFPSRRWKVFEMKENQDDKR